MRFSVGLKSMANTITTALKKEKDPINHNTESALQGKLCTIKPNAQTWYKYS